MPTDPTSLRELKALKEALAHSAKNRTASNSEAAEMVPASSAAAGADAEDRLRERLRELVDEFGMAFESTERNISEHPAASVMGAMLVGILIGRLFTRH